MWRPAAWNLVDYNAIDLGRSMTVDEESMAVLKNESSQAFF